MDDIRSVRSIHVRATLPNCQWAELQASLGQGQHHLVGECDSVATNEVEIDPEFFPNAPGIGEKFPLCDYHFACWDN